MVDTRQRWKLSDYLTQLTYGSAREWDILPILRTAFLDPSHSCYGLALQMDQHRHLITDLLNTAAAQLTTLYATFPRYMRFALIRRMEKRFIGWHPVDGIRVATLDGLLADSDHATTHEVDNIGKTEKITKEKQRKKRLEKKKQDQKRATEQPQVEGPARLPREPEVSNLHDEAAKENVGNDTFLADHEQLCPQVRQTVEFSNEAGSIPAADPETAATESSGCNQSIGRDTQPRSSVTSLWISNTSHSSSEKEGSGNELISLQHEPPSKLEQITTSISALEVSQSALGHSVITHRQEEMINHVRRVVLRNRDPETANMIATILYSAPIGTNSTSSTQTPATERVSRFDHATTKSKALEPASSKQKSPGTKDSSPKHHGSNSNSISAAEDPDIAVELETMPKRPLPLNSYNGRQRMRTRSLEPRMARPPRPWE